MLANDDAKPLITQHALFLPGWNTNLTVIFYNGHQWFVIRQICTLLGIRTDTQVESLRDRDLLEGLVMQLPVQTSKGVRDSWCIDIEAVAAWMIMISDRRVKAEVKPNLLKLQRDIMQAARRVMFGEVGDSPLHQKIADTQRFAWFLEQQIVGLQQQRNLPMPEGDDDGGV